MNWNGIELPEPYFHNDTVCIIHGDCREALSGVKKCSSAIVTDPPYELGFMGKSWDSRGVSFKRETWDIIRSACLHGASLLSFGGSRTQHRIACAIEDAGWELRDVLMWVYGCLSEDTEVLTGRGWERLHKLTQYDKILIHDTENDIYKWETPERWQVYRVHEDTAYRIVSDSTDQLVSRNHRVLVERDGELVSRSVETLAGLENVPILPSAFLDELEKQGELLFSPVQWENSWARMEATCPQGASRVDRREQRKLSGKYVGREESCLEGRGNLFQNARQLQGCEVCSVPAELLVYGPRGRVRYGASSVGSDEDRATTPENGSSASQQPRPIRQQSGGVAFCQQPRPQAVRGRKTYKTTLARVYQQPYSGLIFCPTVSTGAFVARRNGQIFVTGNSGFPKSLDISKAIDKAKGVKHEVVGVSNQGTGVQPNKLNNHGKGDTGIGYMDGSGKTFDLTAPSTPEAQLWDGYGTALKPAYEPIILAMNPVDKTFANNALKHGVAGLNIDECRVPVFESGGRPKRIVHSLRDDVEYHPSSLAGRVDGSLKSSKAIGSTEQGRFPANFLHDGSDEVLRLFPLSKGQQGNVRGTEKSHTEDENTSCYGEYNCRAFGKRGDSSGSAARFFYCAKASRAERGEDNRHPTVKPLALMEYLCQLVKMPEYNLIIDPFMGSGTTLLACSKLGIPCIGIDSDKQSCELATLRYIKYLATGEETE